VEPAINAAISGKQAYCEREPMQLLAEGEGDSLSFHWSGPHLPADTAQSILVASMTPDDEGRYQVTIDNGACRDTAAVEISVRPSPTIEMPRLLREDFCEPVRFRPVITGDDAVTYTWTPAEGLSCADCPDPEIQLPMLPSYQLRVINDSLCTDSATVWVYYRAEDMMYVPNAFSPNLDGVNDYFQLYPSCVVWRIKKLEVFDRWGQLVYSGHSLNPDDPREFWDGQVNGKPAVSGTYVWQTELELVDGRTHRLEGAVNLIR
ncbi:MAG: gliding motility-associated C-terminal domain-containing protein, partial [Lewinella sp.]|nr:gliding motility-associated C-terminal domain-containing protein [Lewinella sp.]